jgi:oxygen-independent coproporphyrinogen-3 oxidase
LEALAWDLEQVERDEHFAPAARLDTLFVGGGTPSLLGSEAMDGLAGVLDRRRLGFGNLEWTAEANPESFSEEVARGWARAGVNRISLGVQSLQEHVLRWLGRLHGSKEAIQAVERVRRVGIGNVSLDLIFGLPRDVDRDMERDLESILALQVPHVSLYGLSVEQGTPLARAVARGEVTPLHEEAYREEYLVASQRLVSEGYEHYEVSNFCLPGAESRHNLTYWELRPYLGLGNSSHSFRGRKRRWNLRDWPAYQKARDEGRPPWGSEEDLGPSEILLERVWLGLRTVNGLPVGELSGSAMSLVRRWVSRGEAVVEGDRLRLTPEGWLVLDDLSVDLEGALTRGSNDDAPAPGGRRVPGGRC